MRVIARSIRGLALAKSCRLGQDYGKGRTQININSPVYRSLCKKPTIIFDYCCLYFGNGPSVRYGVTALLRHLLWVPLIQE